MTKKIIIFTATSGSNLKLAETLTRHAEALGATVEVVNLEDLNFPLFTPKEQENSIPEAAKNLADKLAEVNGFVLLGPEYNGSIPPVISNAIAWMSVTGDDFRASFSKKFAVVGTHSGGGGLKACQAMRLQLEHLGTVVLPRNILTSYSKELNPKSADSILGHLISLC